MFVLLAASCAIMASVETSIGYPTTSMTYKTKVHASKKATTLASLPSERSSVAKQMGEQRQWLGPNL